MLKLNWRQIVLHFIAFCFFYYSFRTFSFLYDTKIIDTFRQSNQDINEALRDQTTTTTELAYFTLWTGIAGTIGILFAFIISLIISIKRKWLWLNSVIILIATFLLARLDLLGWDYLKKFLWFPGHFIPNTIIEFIVNGTILLIVGVLIFFLKAINQFIEEQKL
jgi:hypothetical protein